MHKEKGKQIDSGEFMQINGGIEDGKVQKVPVMAVNNNKGVVVGDGMDSKHHGAFDKPPVNPQHWHNGPGSEL